MDIGAILGTIFVIFLVIAALGGAIKTFQRNWIAALLLLLFLFPVWAIWAFIEIFTGEISPQVVYQQAPQQAPPQDVARHHTATAPAEPAPEMKDCPFCAEPIRLAAIRCRYCGQDLPDPVPPPLPPRLPGQ